MVKEPVEKRFGVDLSERSYERICECLEELRITRRAAMAILEAELVRQVLASRLLFDSHDKGRI